MGPRSALFITSIVGCASAVGAQETPSTDRSRAAITRVRPSLESALRERELRFGAPVFIRIFKESRELELWVQGKGRFELFRSYPICTFSGGLGPKLRTGDLQSPEGFYFVNPGRLNPASRFHLSFDLGYPNAYDRHHGRTGSALMVHGDCVSIGCYAMTDARIEEIYALVDAALRAGQPFVRVHAFPFRMTEANMARNRGSRWRSFWENLRQGYEFFEREKRPPNVEVRGGRYAFEAS
ncbi:MAG: murein L,D-transpeptidase family protein [Myxococcota bacterium]|nr:murein L,D-transpeptidase family protein [Myxococcota bacterium]